MRRDKSHGYTIQVNPETGEQFFVELSTGEIYDAATVTVPVGSQLITPEQQRRNSERRERQQIHHSEKAITAMLGKFYLLAVDTDFSGLSSATVARLVYLATYLRYGTNSLYWTKRTPISRRMLPEVLGVSEDTAGRFMKEAERYVSVDEKGNVHMDQPAFVRGRLPADHAGYQKLRIEAVRRLYKAADVADHKRLGYIFLMLPFISVDYNILCHNPYAADIGDIQPMTAKEFCEKIGLAYNKTTVFRLRRIYADIQFEIDGERQLFCGFVTDGVHPENDKIFVNPKVLYSGRDILKVRGLMELMPKPHSNAAVTTLREVG